MQRDELDLLSRKIIIACIEVHKTIGPGLLESVYEECLTLELEAQGLSSKRQVSIPLIYKGVTVNRNFKIDILVENEIILELKSVEVLLPVFEAQIISYLKLTDKRLGFLINFNVPLMKQGIKRIVNKF